MKHFILFFFASSFLCQGQIIDFPDPNFKNALLNHSPVIDTNNDGEIQISEAEAFSGWLVVANQNISDLTGIEYFIYIYGLGCYQNNLTELDISNCNLLQFVNASWNQLINVQLPDSNSSLQSLLLKSNQLTTIDLSNSLNLWGINIERNQLTNLNLTVNSAIMAVECARNQLTHIDLPNNITTDFRLDCSDNQLTEITFISNSSPVFLRQEIKCSKNLLTELDLSINNVTVLNCEDNPLLETINWQNGWNYEFDSSSIYNSFQNLPNLSSVCIDSYNQELMDFILAEAGHPVDFYNNETCDALSVNEKIFNNLSITPNPVEYNLKIEAEKVFKEIILFNEIGQNVLSFNFSSALNHTVLDVSSLSRGLYHLKITDEIGNYTVKKVIKR